MVVREAITVMVIPGSAFNFMHPITLFFGEYYSIDLAGFNDAMDVAKFDWTLHTHGLVVL